MVDSLDGQRRCFVKDVTRYLGFHAAVWASAGGSPRPN